MTNAELQAWMDRFDPELLVCLIVKGDEGDSNFSLEIVENGEGKWLAIQAD